MEALFIGHAYIDVTFLTDTLPTGDDKTIADDYAVSFGGNAVTAAFAAAKMGVRPDLLCTLADDWLSLMFREMARSARVRLHDRKVSEASLSFIMPKDGKRAIVRCRDDNYLHPFPTRPPSDLAQQRFAQAACVSFTQGTRITLATGAQKPVQDLVVGDRILTRDAGAQPLRWIGHSTQRAIGDFAPVLIRAGALNNAEDLRVSPDHRLFVYQRTDRIGAGRAELRVRARHLINNDSVVQDVGGFVDYFQLLFDTHQIVYAEGIAAETLRLDRRTQPAVPVETQESVTAALPQAANTPTREFDMPEHLARPELAALLKGASTL